MESGKNDEKYWIKIRFTGENLDREINIPCKSEDTDEKFDLYMQQLAAFNKSKSPTDSALAGIWNEIMEIRKKNPRYTYDIYASVAKEEVKVTEMKRIKWKVFPVYL